VDELIKMLLDQLRLSTFGVCNAPVVSGFQEQLAEFLFFGGTLRLQNSIRLASPCNHLPLVLGRVE